MTLQTVSNGVVLPAIGGEISITNTSGKLINATGEKFAAIVQVPKTGTIIGVGFRTGTVSDSQTIKISLQTVSGGNPTGTLYGGSAAVTQASPATNTFYNVTLGTSATATTGDEIAVVIEFDATVGSVEVDSGGSSFSGFPYVNLYTGAWTKDDWIPDIALEYTGGVYHNLATFPVDAVSNLSISSTSTPDEAGLKFTLTGPIRVTGFWMYVDVNSTFDVVLYEGTTAKLTQSVSTNFGSTSFKYLRQSFSSSFVTTKDTAYYLVLKGGTGTAPRLQRFNVSLVGIMDCFDGGQDFHWAERTDAGSWTADTSMRPRAGIIFDQISDNVGGGGGAAGIIKQAGAGGGMVG